MATLEERQKSFEQKYKRDQDKLFRITARRNRLLGLWAAERFGMSGEAVAEYAKEVVHSDFEEPGDADVVRKVLDDFAARGIEMDEPRLRREMDRLLDEAERQIDSEQG